MKSPFLSVKSPRALACATYATLAAAAVLFGACDDTVPEIPADELYLRGFIKEFGVPAEGHTWSVAEQLEAKVAVDARISGELTVYSDAPNAPGSNILASVAVSGGAASVRFDAEQGTHTVYARLAEADGTVVWSGYAAVDGGRIHIGDAGSRSGACPVTAEPLDYQVRRVTENNLDVMKPYVGTGITWEQLLAEKGPDVVDPVDSKVNVSIPRLYALKNFDFSRKTPEFSNLDIIPVVYTYINKDGEEKRGIFGNQSDMNQYGGDDNITRYYYRNKVLDPDVTMTVRRDGPVALDMMWRTTEGEMYWGYYYYKAEDEAALYADPKRFFDEVPKYVVLRRNSIDPEHSISGTNNMMEYRYCDMWSSHPDVYNPDMKHDGDHVIKTEWEPLVSTHAKTISTNIKYFRPSIIRSTSFDLVYFGEDGTGQATYDFPAGTRIGFFYGSTDNIDKFYLGNSSMNYYLFHYHIHPMDAYKPEETPDNYSIFAAKYRYNGSSYVGFEEGGGDNDINDLVFRIHNVVPPKQDLTPEDIDLPTPKEWILACEDLGNTDDYDFNDVVLKLSHVAGSGQLKVTPLACGGVLNSHIYFGGKGEECQWGEIHDLLGVPRGVMAGVGSGHPDIDFSKVETRIFSVPDTWLASESYSDFFIFTERKGASQMAQGTWIQGIVSPGSGEFSVPQMLLLPQQWRWPVERKHIITAYPSFKDWVGKPGENAGWTEQPAGDHHLYNRID